MAVEDGGANNKIEIENEAQPQKNSSNNTTTKPKKGSWTIGKGQFFGLDRKYFFGGIQIFIYKILINPSFNREQ
jgi:hypothetical protein